MARERKHQTDIIKVMYRGKEVEHLVKDSFVIYTNNISTIEFLDDEQAGKVFKALFYYNMGELDKVDELINGDGDKMVGMAWSRIKDYMDIDGETYYKKCQVNQANAKKAAAKRYIRNYKNFSDYGKKEQEELSRLISVAEIEIDDAETPEQVEIVKTEYKNRMDELKDLNYVPF